MQPAVNLLVANDLTASSLPEIYKSQKADVRHFVLPQLGIDEVRQITNASSYKSLGAGDYVFVIVATNITHEAQNALLKLFEEPPTKTIFYLIIPAENLLLPTLRSRFILADSKLSKLDNSLADEFMRLGYSERLELIANKVKNKDVVWMESLVTGLGQIDKEKNLEANFKRSLLLCESYFRIRGAGKKMILEELALSLPVS